jgi:hypothetical protein
MYINAYIHIYVYVGTIGGQVNLFAIVRDGISAICVIYT